MYMVSVIGTWICLPNSSLLDTIGEVNALDNRKIGV